MCQCQGLRKQSSEVIILANQAYKSHSQQTQPAYKSAAAQRSVLTHFPFYHHFLHPFCLPFFALCSD